VTAGSITWFSPTRYPGWVTECSCVNSWFQDWVPALDVESRTAPLLDLRESIVSRALSNGATVETVSAEAATLLLTYGGLGAWTATKGYQG
jgi:hypothetical protein